MFINLTIYKLLISGIMSLIKYDEKTELYLTNEIKEAAGTYFGKLNNLIGKGEFPTFCSFANKVISEEDRRGYLKEFLKKEVGIGEKETGGMIADIISSIHSVVSEESYETSLPEIPRGINLKRFT